MQGNPRFQCHAAGSCVKTCATEYSLTRAGKSERFLQNKYRVNS